jgi:DNA-binding GntR family transcriptional regulator
MQTVPDLALRKKPLREDVHPLLRERIVAGRFPSGSRLRDFALAAEFGISRTPVREALLRLEREGLVESDPNRGFFVAPLSRQVILETYPLVWTLECLALDSSGPPTASQLQILRQINAELAASPDDALARQQLDMRWHQALVEPCGNQRLLELLAGLKQIVRRYECVYMQDRALVRRSVRDHNEIVAALVANQRRLAGRLLQRNWRAGMEDVLRRLDESRQPTAE